MLLTNARAEIAATTQKTDWASISREITVRLAEQSRNEVKKFEREMQQFANDIARKIK